MTTATDHLVRAIRLQKPALVGLTGFFVLAVGWGFGLGHDAANDAKMAHLAPEITHYTAGDNWLSRIWDDGEIDYLTIDFAHGSVEGIPSWTRLHIDASLTRDRMGNVTRVSGR